MLRIAIVDDDMESIRTVRSYIQRFCSVQELQWDAALFQDAKDLLRHYNSDYDLIFLDIDMPGINGMDAAKTIRTTDGDTALIFVTQMAQYAINGYQVDALDFIVKPVEYYSFEMAFRKFLRIYQQRTKQNIAVMVKGKLTILPFSAIKYIEVIDHYLTYHTSRGDYTVKGTLSDVEDSLAGGPFFKCNRCYIVNVQAITAVEKDRVLIDSIGIDVSRSKRKEMLRIVVESLGGNI